MNEVVLDFTSVGTARGKKRSKRDIDTYWDSRYNKFIKAGFTEREATKAASQGLSVRNKQVRGILRSRKDVVALYIRHGRTREEAIEEASHDLESRLERLGIDELNLFYEVSP